MDAHEVKGAVREAAGKAEQVYGHLKDEVSEKASFNEAQALVQDNPGTAIGISLLAGAALGALLAYKVKN